MTSAEKTTQARRFLVRGRVQGVGFRWFVEREAHILGIAGWVRNNADGSVEILAMGSRDQLLGLRSRLREGPRAARVDDVRGSRSQAGRRPDNFSHRRSLVNVEPVPAQSRLDCEPLKKLIREVPDFPKKGILFYDITTLLKDKLGLAMLIDALAEHYIKQDIDLVLGMEARGFIFAPALAYRLNAGFVPLRKPGKLPAATAKFDYALEYGTNTLEIHKDAIQKGQRVLIVDDLLATGGTANATARLASSLGAEIAGLGFVVELDFLKRAGAAAGIRRILAAALRER